MNMLRLESIHSYLKRAHERFIDRHHSFCVVKLSAVVWSREEGYQLSLCEELVPILDNLMSSANQIQVVSIEEL